MRLDAFLKERYSRRSRESLKRAIDSGAISLKRSQGPHVAVGRLKPGLQLLGGDEVLVLSERKPEPEVCFDYKILHEKDGLFVIDKPPNLPVHPAGRYFFNTLLIHLKTEGHRKPLQVEREYYLVHRIDKETSGVLVLTRDRESCANLTRQFAERRTEKTYLAIVRGHPPDTFEVNAAMKRDENSEIKLKMRIAPESEGGQSALTAFKCLSRHGDYSLVECHPHTGRQHQIRLHLDHVGHPIVGDKLYGLPESEALRFYERMRLSPEAESQLLLPRHALHAHRIFFDHPISGERLEFVSELPQDLRDFLEINSRRRPAFPAESSAHQSLR
jgi:23S rRNA pseudouridine1911/1915/1917 synthase